MTEHSKTRKIQEAWYAIQIEHSLSKEEIMEECSKMAAIGVFPTVMPFRPMDNCELYGFSRCKPEELIEMSDYLGGLLHKYALDFRKQPGCTECGGCSLENDCYRRREKNKKQ